MPYQSLPLPTETPAVVGHAIRRGVEPFLADVHAMLRLPLPAAGLTAGCGFSIAQVLLSVVSGASVLLYSANGSAGEIFRGFLADFYPWSTEPQREGLATGLSAAELLWDEYRNPFAHAAGIAIKEQKKGVRALAPRAYQLKVKRITRIEGAELARGLSEEEIEQLEKNARPAWLGATVIDQSHKRVLFVEPFYWGVRQAILAVCAEPSRMARAHELLKDANIKAS